MSFSEKNLITNCTHVKNVFLKMKIAFIMPKDKDKILTGRFSF